MGNNINHVPILDGLNYPLWSILIDVELSACGLRDVCSSELSPTSDPSVIGNWNQLNVEAVQLILSRLHPKIIVTVVNAKLLWTTIHKKFASQTITNRGRTWVRWECLRFNGNIEEYVKECLNILFKIAGIGIVMPPDIMAYSILGNISRDSNAYDHIIDSMVLTMNSSINLQLVLDKLSELLQHKNTKDMFQKGIKTEKMDGCALLTNSSDYPYKMIYVCRDGKHNPKNTTHKTENCWAEYPELRPPPRNKNKKKTSEAETRQTSLEALLTHQKLPSSSSSTLVIDCGATHHMFSDKSIFTKLILTPEEKIATSNPRSNLTCKGKGTVEIEVDKRLLTLYNCLYVPNITKNLVSLLELCTKSMTIQKTDATFQLLNDNQILLNGQLINKLMCVSFNRPRTFLSKLAPNRLWHLRLGDQGNQVLKSLGLQPCENDFCDTCVKGKMTHLPFKSHFTQTIKPLYCLHMDLIGPISPPSNSGHRYILTIINQHTSFKITSFLKKKSDTYEESFKQKNLIENIHDQKIKQLVTDGGGEFVNQQFKELANQNGFNHTIAPPYTPEHNRIAERANRTILDKAQCLLLTANLPNQYWAEAINTATFLTNILPTPSKKNLSPYLLWTTQSPKIKRIRTFGCKVVFLIPKQKRSWKLGPVVEEGVLLGFNNDSSYQILKLSDRKVYCSRHVVFFENKFPISKDSKESDVPLLINSWCNSEEEEVFFDCQEEMNEEETHNEENLISSESNDLDDDSEHSSLESRLPPNAGCIKVIGPQHPTLINSEIREENILPYSCRPTAFLSEADPLTYNQAINSKHHEHWLKAIAKELQNMTDLNFWEEVAVKEETKLIGTTWVFKTKRNDLNQIIEHKARLCAQGFSQTQGKDYSKTFAPTGRLNSLRTLISYAAVNNLKFEQLDIKSAFLNAPLEEDIYLTIPQGLDRDKKHTCLKLKKAIYGLKQAPLAWYKRLSSWLVNFGFNISKADSYVFYLKSDKPLWLFLHVNDIGIFGRNLTHFKKAIEQEFQTKLLGSANLMLGIKIVHQPDTITLTQSHYIDSLLENYGMSKCKYTVTPLIPNMHLEASSRTDQEEFASLKINYQSAVGSLSYLSTATRPDLSYSVSALCQFLENPGIQHWRAFMHVLKSLKGTSETGLVYKKNTSKLPVAYSNAGWGNCRVTRRSTTGYLIFFNDNLVIWKTRKQPTVSLSSGEAKYRSLADLTSKLLWFKQFSEEINILTMTGAISIHEDNQGCINTANSDCNTNTRRMKHIDIQLHFIQDLIENKTIKLIYTPTASMLADFLTKSVSRPAIKRAMQELRLLTTGDKGGVEICDLSQSVSN
ncbi:hypothetical protein O181_022211 [Austropuccinia psidii MF-1]|uniref:Integrase catalytic domain-containing protein n=1 Tax=Austropuccinia psidii MF-1 TaxID=1389203 RepID=A0A9Q3CGZ8_9BASI|nr:hypothetical protein [Austropuccinia psidii MF-1]